MCKARGKLAGAIAAGMPVAATLAHVPGYSGMVLIKYTGKKESARLPASLESGVRYQYGVGRPVFYVDARDIARTLCWQENGDKVFAMLGPDDNGTASKTNHGQRTATALASMRKSAQAV